MYTLYYSPGTASMVVHLALLEIGAPYQLKRVDFATDAQHDPKYLELNPHGTVPTLLIDGKPRAIHIPAELADKVRERIELRRRFDAATATICGINLKRFLKEKEPR